MKKSLLTSFILCTTLLACHKSRLGENGVVTTGIFENTNSGNENCIVKYNFTINLIEYRGSSECDDCSTAVVGDSISIIYLPDYPFINDLACKILVSEKVKHP